MNIRGFRKEDLLNIDIQDSQKYILKYPQANDLSDKYKSIGWTIEESGKIIAVLIMTIYDDLAGGISVRMANLSLGLKKRLIGVMITLLEAYGKRDLFAACRDDGVNSGRMARLVGFTKVNNVTEYDIDGCPMSVYGRLSR